VHRRAIAPACLTGDQVTTMKKYYAGTIDPVNGQVINPGAPRGTETEDVFALGLAFQERLPEPAFDGLFYWVFGPSFGYPASQVNFANFDFHHDIGKVDNQLADVLNANSTDLSEFREHGGKLLMYHGWADPLIPAQSSVNYFNALVKNGGGGHHGFQQVSFDGGGNSQLQRTQSYARLCSWRPACSTAPAAPAPTCSTRSRRSSNGSRRACRRRRSSRPNSSTIRRLRF
jgi:feruloyl esterase